MSVQPDSALVTDAYHSPLCAPHGAATLGIVAGFVAAFLWFALLYGIWFLVPLQARASDEDAIQQHLQGRRLVSRMSGDVTGDRIADVVLVLSDERRMEFVVTVLRRRHGDKTADGKAPLPPGLDGVDSLQVEMTPLGPPTVKAVKGILIVESLTGGMSVRTAATYRYRFDAEEGRMRLIGLDAERKSSTHSAKLSWNLLTGAQIVKRGDGPDLRRTEKPDPIYMSLTPDPEKALEQAIGKAR
jgi:hypothetical protein